MGNELSPRVARFLRDNVSSYEALETLLFLAHAPATALSSAQIAQSLRAAEDPIDSALEALLARNLIQATAGGGPRCFRFAASDPSLAELVAELERAYTEQRMAVLMAMNANALERIRSAAAQRLANAFRFERPKK